MKTMAQLAQEALDIQDACNLSGLVHGWSRSITDLRARLAEQGITDTSAINSHPINQLWADKLHDLAGRGGGDSGYSVAYDACQELARMKQT